jgi:transketolase
MTIASAPAAGATDARLAHAIRFLAIDAIVRAGEGHQGVPLGMAEIATALYTRHLKFDAADPTWPDRDRVVLSNGHGSMLLYALLHLTGYARIGIEQVSTFRDFGSRCEGHPEIDPASGIEVTTGPLGQGIANALGMAVAEAWLSARFGPGVVDHHTYAFVGDGCLQEGVGQETIALAGHLRLGKLVLLWDDNRITDDGSTELSISEDVAERFRVAGWHVVAVDGHDIEAVSDALAAAKADPRPSMIACRTVIARGLARLQGQRGGHSARLLAADAAQARRDLGWDTGPFEMPGDVLGSVALRRRAPPCAERDAWAARVAALPAAGARRVRAACSPAACQQGWRERLRTSSSAEALAARAGGQRNLRLCRDQRHARRLHARAPGGLCRSRSADQPQATARRVHRGRPPRRLPALRRARTRDGCHGQRHGRAWRCRAADA